MSGQEPEKTVCRQCSGPLDAGAPFCPRCRAPAGGAVAYHPKPRPDWAESRAMVLFLLFAALGPLALPLLWRSPKFSRTWKIVLTVLAAIQTAAVVWLLWYVVHWFVESLKEYGIASALPRILPALLSARVSRPRRVGTDRSPGIAPNRRGSFVQQNRIFPV